ncbi:MAG: lysophospholipid acyltransferase family protein [SAR324 cluster bacterium]|nr:lysophospholipid acyltransferase family protein [SAR324 cluster bacterium]
MKDIIITRCFSWMIRLTGLTTKVIELNKEAIEPLKQNYILSTWHSNIYFSCWILRDQYYGSMISNSRDGEMIAKVMEQFNFVPIRGSTSKGATRALREMIKYLKGPYPVAITPDGPKGPIHKVQSGAIMMAKMTGMPIVPWSFDALDQHTVHKSWDHHKIPKPFTIAVSSFGTPFYVPKELSGEEVPEFCEKLEQVMLDNDHTASAAVDRLKQEGVDSLTGKLRFIFSP